MPFILLLKFLLLHHPIQAKLHNEINSRHLDNKLGRELFNVREKMVRVGDLQQLVVFLRFCQERLVTKQCPEAEGRGGFLRFSSEEDVSDVPYLVLGGVKHLPLFYFEGEVESLASSTVKAGAWELPYLRLLCRVQGLPQETLQKYGPRLVPLDRVLEHFPPAATTKEFWPMEDFLPRSGGSCPGAWTLAAPSPQVQYSSPSFTNKYALESKL